MVDSGSDVHTIIVSVEQWSAILRGVETLIEGQVYSLRGVFEQGYWRFNSEEFSQLAIYTSLSRDIYSGDLTDSAVTIELTLE